MVRWLTAFALFALVACQPQTTLPTPTLVPTPAPAPTTAPAATTAPSPTRPLPPAAGPTISATARAAPPVTSSRVDVLNQANAAFASGNYASASGLYERVLNTPPTGEPAEARVAINELAHFRNAVALLQTGDEDAAKAEVDALQQQDANAPLARLASQLWDQYGMVGDVRGACAQIQPQIASQAGPTLTTLQTLGVSIDPSRLCG